MKTSLILILLLGNSLFSTQGLCNETEELDPIAIWKKNCMKCHAADGSGSTKIGKKFGVNDYTDPDVQASFTDEDIIIITKEGIFDENGKQKMPGYGEKLTEEEIQALTPVIRSFVKK